MARSRQAKRLPYNPNLSALPFNERQLCHSENRKNLGHRLLGAGIRPDRRALLRAGTFGRRRGGWRRVRCVVGSGRAGGAGVGRGAGVLASGKRHGGDSGSGRKKDRIGFGAECHRRVFESGQLVRRGGSTSAGLHRCHKPCFGKVTACVVASADTRIRLKPVYRLHLPDTFAETWACRSQRYNSSCREAAPKQR